MLKPKRYIGREIEVAFKEPPAVDTRNQILSDRPCPDGESYARGSLGRRLNSVTRRRNGRRMAKSLGPDAPIPRTRYPTADWLRRSPRIAMVQTTDFRERNDPAASGRFDGPGFRRVLAESKVRYV